MEVEMEGEVDLLSFNK